MQTPSVQAANNNSNQTTAKNNNSNVSAEFSFDKILTREMGERAPGMPIINIAATPAKSSPAPQNNPGSASSNANAQKIENKNATNKTSAPAPQNNNNQAKATSSNNDSKADASNTDNNTEAASIAKGEPSPNASSTTGDKDGVSKDASTDTASEDSQTVLGSAMPADMLALVASFNQPVAKGPQIAQVDNKQANLADTVGNADAANLAKLEASVAASGDKAMVGKSGKDDKVETASTFGDALAQVASTEETSKVLKADGEAAATVKKEGSEKAEPELASLIESGKQVISKLDSSATSAQTRPASTPASNDGMPKMADILAAAAAKPSNHAADLAANAKIVENVVTTNIAAPSAAANTDFAKIATIAANEKIAPTVGSKGWDQAVGQKVIWMVAGGEQTAELTLNPPDMGPMKVVLSVSNDQTSIAFTAAQPEVRQALEAAMPKLREMMSEAGVNLGSSTVSTSLPDQQQQAQSGQQNNGSRHAGGNTGFGNEEGSNIEAAPIVRSSRVTSGLGAVDTFV